MKNALRRPETIVFGIVLLFSLAFAAFTQHIWEDYWITFRASLNLATGNGLVFTPGERLHTFTSPLGTILPAALSWLTGNHADFVTLWLFRVISTATLAAGMVIFFRTFQALELKNISCWLIVALIGLDAKIVDFSINGMETGLLVFFLALAINGLLVPGPRQIVRIGIGWAGLMWSRPDSCVYVAILGLGMMLFLPEKNPEARRFQWGKKIILAGLCCAVLYLPWFIWAWSYYGTPVPHTIAAKGATHAPFSAAALAMDFVKFPALLLSPGESSKQIVFLPPYADHGGWPGEVTAFVSLLGSVACFAWVVPWLRRPTRFFSLGFFLGNFYLTGVLNYFPPWYLPTVSVFGYLTLGNLFDEALGLAEKWRQRAARPAFFSSLVLLAHVGAVALVLGQLALTASAAWQLRQQQAIIEDGLRQPIGLWLREHARTPHDSVMLEPLGYIGYYSRLKMLDYPGLASKEMVEARRRLGAARENQAYRELKPDWIVLRPNESRSGRYIDVAGLAEYYELVRTFDATEKINAIAWLPGRPYLQYDQTFLVYHRKAEAAPAAVK